MPTPAKEQPPSSSGSPSPGGGSGSLSSVANIQSGVDISGFKSDFQERVSAMATAFQQQTGKKLLITSGFRSNEKQKELYDAKVKELGGNEAAARKLVAEPMAPLGKGRGSFHLKGLAIDINSKGPAGINVLAGPRDAPTGWLEKFGLTRPVKKEDWHVQLSGSVPTPDNPVSPGGPTLIAGKDGKPVDLNSGKKESISGAGVPTSASGNQVASASGEVASGQRQQQKPTTPVVINAPTTNTTVINKTQTASAPPPKNTANALVARAA
jgi:hypothetical protein